MKGGTPLAYTLHKQIKDNSVLRSSFFSLAKQVFDLTFAPWFQAGYWTQRYIPYVIAEEDTVAANASVNIMDTSWHGIFRRYIQIGTVMTAPAYRNQGLARCLLETILYEWKEQCDCIYLFANDSVLDFYPKFGFVPSQQYQYTMPVTCAAGDFKKLDMDCDSDRNLLKQCYQRSNPFAELPMQNNYGLLMFYCGSFLKDCVYYSRALDMVCIASQEGSTLLCHDIYGAPTCTVQQVICRMAAPGTKQVQLGFTPKDTQGCICSPIDSDETLFVLDGGENLFKDNYISFPELSHA